MKKALIMFWLLVCVAMPCNAFSQDGGIKIDHNTKLDIYRCGGIFPACRIRGHFIHKGYSLLFKYYISGNHITTDVTGFNIKYSFDKEHIYKHTGMFRTRLYVIKGNELCKPFSDVCTYRIEKG